MSADTTKPATPEELTGPVLYIADTLGLAAFAGVSDLAEIAHEVDLAARPHYYRQAADSLRAIAEHRLATAPDAVAHARAEGIHEAATALERAAEDMEDTGG